ncbi:MAG: BatA and WFA domain-containing protein [Planctomycetes bacterium]|nr:BatA and WFA domain-containing protein [Planctomycetota bacterium]
MSFLNLVALWTAAGVVPALLILYFLKLRRREELVPSTLLWKRAVQDLQVNAPFQRLRKNLLLFLQLLVLLAGVIALARPIIQTTAAQEKSLVLLIDRSASMNALEGNQTRFELAQEQATRLVKTLNRTGSRWFSFGGAIAQTRVMVVAFADRATVVSPFTTNTAELASLIADIEPTDGRTNLREALDLAEAYMAPPARITQGMEEQNVSTPVSPETASKLLLLSDGGVGDLEELVLTSSTMELIRIGQTRDNVGITALRTQRNYERPEILSAFLQVGNFGPEPVTTDVSIYVDGNLWKVRPHVALAAAPLATATQPATAAPSEGTTASLSFELDLDHAAVLEARLSRGDALALDNRAFAIVPPPRKLHVLLVSAGNFFLESALRGLPLQKLVYLTPEQYEAAEASDLEVDGQSKYDVVILDKHATARLPVGNYLFIGAAPRLPGIEVTAEKKDSGPVAFMWWDETHPVLRHVTLEYVYVADRLLLQMPAEAESLIEGPDGAVLTRYAKDGRHFLILTFAIEHSTWWRKPSFPVFAYNALRYLGSGGALAEEGASRPGDTLRIPLPLGADSTALTRPDGSETTLTADASGLTHFGGTYQVGVYRVQPGVPERDRFAINLEDEWESDITPRSNLQIGAQQVAEGQAIRVATPEIWRWFIGVALLVALIEWYIYNRRVMI